MKLSRRIKASRANGAKSRGPKTEEGKLRSQTHAIRHGLLARCVVIEGEDPEAFKVMMAELEARFHPVGDVELGMLEEMAAAYWRMRRGWSVEAELLNQGVRSQSAGTFEARLANAFTAEATMPKIALLQRYESRLHRMYQRALKNLIMLREEKQTAQVSEEPIPVSGHSPQPPSVPEVPPPTPPDPPANALTEVIPSTTEAVADTPRPATAGLRPVIVFPNDRAESTARSTSPLPSVPTPPTPR